MPQKMKVSNPKEYNKFLQERGNIFHYINKAMEKDLTLKGFFKAEANIWI